MNSDSSYAVTNIVTHTQKIKMSKRQLTDEEICCNNENVLHVNMNLFAVIQNILRGMKVFSQQIDRRMNATADHLAITPDADKELLQKKLREHQQLLSQLEEPGSITNSQQANISIVNSQEEEYSDEESISSDQTESQDIDDDIGYISI